MHSSSRYLKTHSELKKQALALFLEKGYDSSSIQEITLNAGVSVGAFYRHFPSKDMILAEIWTEYTSNNIAETLKHIDKFDTLEPAIEFLLQESNKFANDEITNKLYPIYTSLALSEKLNTFPNMENSAQRYRRTIYNLIQTYCVDFTDEEALTTANAIHCLLNTNSIQNADSAHLYHFDEKALHKCIFSLLHI